MKRFKDILNEFREINNRNNGGRGNPGDNPSIEIKEFMRKTPFTHVTTGEHEIHFKSSLDAAHSIADSLGVHEAGRIHAHGIGDKNAHEYFMSSAGTHDDVLNAIQDHISNHPNLPSHLREHVPLVIHNIETEHGIEKHSPEKIERIGKFAMQTFKAPTNATGRHPSLYDDTHHLKMVLDALKENPDDGYFLEKNEYK